MNTIYKVRRTYLAPVIEKVILDNEISLALESIPPGGPNEGLLNTPEYLKNDPFNVNLG